MARTGNWGPAEPQEKTEDRQRKYTYEKRIVPSGLDVLASGLSQALKIGGKLVDMRSENLQTERRIDAISKKGSGKGKSKGSPIYVPITEDQRVFMAQGVGPNPQQVEDYGPPAPETQLPADNTPVESPKEDQLKRFDTDMQRIKTALDQGKITQSQARTLAGSKSRELTVGLGSSYVDYHDRIINSMKPITGASMMAIPQGLENSARVNQSAREAAKLGIDPRELVGLSDVQIQAKMAPYHAMERRLDLAAKELAVVSARIDATEKSVNSTRPAMEAAIDAKILNKTFAPLKDKMNDILRRASVPGGLDQREAIGVFTQIEQAIRDQYEVEWTTPNASTNITPAVAYKDKSWTTLADRFIKHHVDPIKNAIMSSDVNYANVARNQVEYINGEQTQRVADITANTSADLYGRLERTLGKDHPTTQMVRAKYFQNPDIVAPEADMISLNLASHVLDPTTRYNLNKGIQDSIQLRADQPKNIKNLVTSGVGAISTAKTGEEIDVAVQDIYTDGRGYIRSIAGDGNGYASNADAGQNMMAAFDMAVTPEAARNVVTKGSSDSAQVFGKFVASASNAATTPILADLIGDGYTVVIGADGKVQPKSPVQYGVGKPVASVGARLTDLLTVGTRGNAAVALQRHVDKLVAIGKAMGEDDPVAFAAGVIGLGRSGVIYEGDIQGAQGTDKAGGGAGTDPIAGIIDQQGITYNPEQAQAAAAQQSQDQYGGGVDAIISELKDFPAEALQDPKFRTHYNGLLQSLSDQFKQGYAPQGLEQGIPVKEGSRESMGVRQGEAPPPMVPAPRTR